MRLDKYLADASAGTRSQVKELIHKKQVTVDGTVVTDPAYHVSDDQTVVCQGSAVGNTTRRYYMFHKPGGCVTATRDRERTVMDYFDRDAGRGLFPVGRLDKDTEGLLLVTNDGAFSHRLMSPKRHVEKLYYFEGKGQLCRDAAALAVQGIDIGDEKPAKPAKLYFCPLSDTACDDWNTGAFDRDVLTYFQRQRIACLDSDVRGLIAVTEGRYHQVKRMLLRLGATVVYLKRIAIGSLFLDESLAPGCYRMLTENELAALAKQEAGSV